MFLVTFDLNIIFLPLCSLCHDLTLKAMVAVDADLPECHILHHISQTAGIDKHLVKVLVH